MPKNTNLTLFYFKLVFFYVLHSELDENNTFLKYNNCLFGNN